MELQLTDFENAAFAAFIVLLGQVGADCLSLCVCVLEITVHILKIDRS